MRWEDVRDALPVCFVTMHPINEKLATALRTNIYKLYSSVPLKYLFADDARDLSIGL